MPAQTGENYDGKRHNVIKAALYVPDHDHCVPLTISVTL